ncbi:MAG TPA: MFS transporter [Gemmatimonadaceae bacterium]|nr:MFS transporter [Gemmatimonadaceae bacterium]
MTGPETSAAPHDAHAAPGQASTRKWWILTAVGVGTFMSALDASVVNTMLPLISRGLGSSIATIEWVVTAYLLVVSALLLGVGWLGDVRGHKQTYLIGFAVFVLGSALCGASPSAGWLIAFRVLQGLGAAMLFANSPAILTKNFPASERGRALGLQAMMTYLGLTTGPSLGGWLTGVFGWRSIFYINVPIGVLAMALSMRYIPRDAPGAARERFDMAGGALFALGLTALLLALDQGHVWGWGSAFTLGLIVGAVLVLSAFIWREAHVATPMLDLQLFHSRPFSAATLSAVLNYICAYCVVFILPFYLIRGMGFGPARAGLFMTAQPIVMVITAPLSGALSDRIGARLLTTLGMAFMGAGLLLLAQLDARSGASAIIVALAVVGLGTGMFTSPNNSALMGAAPGSRQGIAAGIMATARNVGMVLGIGLAGAVFTSVLAHAHAAPGALFHATHEAFLAATAAAAGGLLVSALRGRAPAARARR